MILPSAAKILRAAAALPAAGALVALATLDVKSFEYASLVVSYTPQAASTGGCCRVTVRWIKLTDPNIATTEVKGVELSGQAALTDEFYERPLIAGGAGEDVYPIDLVVPVWANKLKAYVSQVGDLTLGHEGTVAVSGWTGKVAV